MNWIIASMLMFASSVAMYVSMRKATLLKINSYYINLSNFLPPLFFYFMVAIFTHPKLTLSLSTNWVSLLLWQSYLVT